MNNSARLLCNLHFYFRVRLAVNIIYINLLWSTTVYSHRRLTSFGPVTDLSLTYTPTGLAVSYGSGTPEIAVTAKQSSTISFYRLTGAGALVQTGTFRSSGTPRDITSLDLPGSGKREYITLSSEGISFIEKSAAGIAERVIPLQSEADRFTIADINNDKRRDICVFGRKVSGVLILLGQPSGGFRVGSTLFPELSVSDLKTSDINGDGITDVILLNWLSDQLTVFYGIGQGIYAEQVAVDLPGTPSDLAIGTVTKERTMQVVATLPNKHALATLTGNSTGEFDITGSIDCAGEPSGVALARINDDVYQDIISSVTQGITVFLGKSTAAFGPPTEFGVGSNITSWLIADLDGDAKNDLVFVDGNSQQLGVLANADCAGNVEWPPRYAVGASPIGLLPRDLNADGLTDIGVVNNVSSTLSILLNLGKGRMSGQQALRLPERPIHISAVHGTLATDNTLITSHSSVDKITIVQLGDEIQLSSSFIVPTGSNPEVVLANEDPSTRQLEMLVRCKDPMDSSPSLSLFTQISGGQFLERSIRSNLPDMITALTVDEFSQKGRYDLFVVSHNKTSRRSTISMGIAEREFDFRTTKPLLSFPDPLATTHSIFTGFVNGDGYKDIVVCLGSPRNELGILYGRKEGLFRDSLEWVRNVHPLSTDAVRLSDVDGDGYVDITLIDAIRNSVIVFYGRENGRFGAPVHICSARDITAICVAGLRRQGVQDLVLSHRLQGTVSIIWDPFRR